MVLSRVFKFCSTRNTTWPAGCDCCLVLFVCPLPVLTVTTVMGLMGGPVVAVAGPH